MMPQMMPQSLAEAGQGALAVNRKLVEMTQANVRSGSTSPCGSPR